MYSRLYLAFKLEAIVKHINSTNNYKQQNYHQFRKFATMFFLLSEPEFFCYVKKLSILVYSNFLISTEVLKKTENVLLQPNSTNFID